MLTFIVVTLLNTSHGQASETSIRTKDITALRTPQSGEGCAINHKSLEDEILIQEPCSVIREQLNAKPEKATKAKKPQMVWGR